MSKRRASASTKRFSRQQVRCKLCRARWTFALDHVCVDCWWIREQTAGSKLHSKPEVYPARRTDGVHET